ncbi:MAG: hypothetical protein GY943_20160 [Chloroflexi bacterium]|nr:hypothetical protein [Chloroflexota bacterium]
MIIKLPADRVKELTSNGDRLAFAPNGRTFREWVAIEKPDEAQCKPSCTGDLIASAPYGNVS